MFTRAAQSLPNDYIIIDTIFPTKTFIVLQ